MTLNWLHVTIWAVVWLAAYKVGSLAVRAILSRPGNGRHSR